MKGRSILSLEDLSDARVGWPAPSRPEAAIDEVLKRMNARAPGPHDVKKPVK